MIRAGPGKYSLTALFILALSKPKSGIVYEAHYFLLTYVNVLFGT
jgi:hypothetical protein